jgi:sugar phosphate isomerase/epimerase
MFRNLNASALGVSGHQSEVIELALTYGYQGLDIDVAEYATRVKLHGVPYARRLVASARLKLGTFTLPLELNADDATFSKKLQKLAEYAQVAAEVGCTRCVTTVMPADDTRPYHENFELCRQRLSSVCGVLKPSGIKLGVGFMAAESLRKGRAFQFIHELDALTLLLNMVAASNIGLLLDLWDLSVSGGTVDTIRKLPAAQIVAVQVANYLPGTPVAELTPDSRLLPSIEGGAVDTAACLAALSEMGYDGPVTVVPSSGALKQQRRDLVVKEAAESLQRAWKAAGLGLTGKPMAAARS